MQRVPHQRVGEPEPLRSALDQKPAASRVLDRIEDIVAGEGGQQFEVDVHPDYRGRPQDRLGRLGQFRHSVADDIAHARRHRRHDVRALGVEQAGEFPDEEWVATAALMDQGGQCRGSTALPVTVRTSRATSSLGRPPRYTRVGS